MKAIVPSLIRTFVPSIIGAFIPSIIGALFPQGLGFGLGLISGRVSIENTTLILTPCGNNAPIILMTDTIQIINICSVGGGITNNIKK